MRMRVPLMALAAFLLCSHSACRRSADAHNLTTVDSLLLITDSLINATKALDMAQVERIGALYAPKADRIEARLHDTLKKEEAIMLGNYHRAMTKNMARTKRDYGPVLKRLDVSRVQLANLRNDVDKGLLRPEVELAYIGEERLALEKALRDAESIAAGVASVIRDQSSYGAAVDSLLAQDTLRTR